MIELISGVEALPTSGGSYVLALRSSTLTRVTIGRLGEATVAPGWYLYVGSALGSGGLRGRLRHHVQAVRRPHWHIDYLRQVCTVEQVWCVVDAQCWEHCWAEQLATMATPAPRLRFGASDCRCIAHCFFVKTRPQCVDFVAAVRLAHPELPEVLCIAEGLR